MQYTLAESGARVLGASPFYVTQKGPEHNALEKF